MRKNGAEGQDGVKRELEGAPSQDDPGGTLEAVLIPRATSLNSIVYIKRHY